MKNFILGQINLRKFLKGDIFIFLLFILIFYAIFRYSETFNKGYNIYEDNLLITTSQSLDINSFPNVIVKSFINDLNGKNRFRPFFIVYLVSTVRLFGTDLLSINIFLAFICICTSFLLYKFCTSSGLSSLNSFLFALLTLVGSSTVMWTRPEDSEIIGMFMLSLSLFFLSKSIYSETHQLLYKICFIVTSVFMSLSKESFLLFIPALMFLYILFYGKKNNAGFYDSFKKSYKVIFILTFVSSVIFIALFLSAQVFNRSYTGMDFNLFSVRTISNFFVFLFKILMFLLIVTGILILTADEFLRNKFKSEFFIQYKRELSKVLVFMMLVILPQFLLYYKTGFQERYYLPLMLGFSFTLIYIFNAVFSSKTIFRIVKYLYLFIIIFYLAFELTSVTIPSLQQFSGQCRATTETVNTILSQKNANLLIVMDPVQNYHEVYSLKTYLNYLNGNKKFNYKFVKSDYASPYFSDTAYNNKLLSIALKSLGKDIIDSVKNIQDIHNIFLFRNLNRNFIENSKDWFKPYRYFKQEYGRFILYTEN